MITPINRVLVMVLVMVLVCIPIIPFTLVYRHKEGRRGSPDHHQLLHHHQGVQRGSPWGGYGGVQNTPFGLKVMRNIIFTDVHNDPYYGPL